MKTYSIVQKHLLAVAIFVSAFCAMSKVSAQIINTDLRAIVYNGKIAIQVKDALSTSTYFAIGTDGKVGMTFYFGLDDPRNGVYSAGLSPQPNGKVNLGFADIPYQVGDTLSFSAIETLTTGTTREYVFVKGDYFPEGGNPITTCPTSITCDPFKLHIFYPPSIPIGVGSFESFQLFMPGLCQNGSMGIGNYSPSEHALIVTYRLPGCGPFDCNQIMTGVLTIIVNGITCVFQNGQPTNNCSPWGNYYAGNTDCASYFEGCTPELMELMGKAKFTLPCRQWIDYNSCNTTAQIKRSGKVAIGTSNFSASNLTVKNGIITDKVKVIDTGWGDYVFETGYPLMPLPEVEAYVARYHHLPDMPSANRVESEASFELGETTINHQVKIEEIFLHLIDLEAETKRLESVLFLQETLSRIRIK